jgi:putative hemolysin
MATNLTTLALTTMGTVTVVELFGPASGDLYAFVILTPLLLIFGEIIPKSVMQQVSEAVAPIVIYPLRWFRYLVYPLIAVFSQVAHLVARLAGAGAAESKLFMTREQLSAVVEVAEKTSHLAAFDQGRIRKVMRVAQATVGEAMIPMAEVVAINQDHPTEEAIAKMRAADVNRLPVYQGTASNVIGIAVLESWDLMDPEVRSRSLASMTGPAHFVWPGQLVEEVLPALPTRADRMAWWSTSMAQRWAS